MRALLGIAASLALLGACSAESDLVVDPYADSYDPDVEVYDGDTAATDGPDFVRLDVFPPDLLMGPSGAAYLAQSFVSDVDGAEGDLVLDPPVRFEGVLSAYATSPYRDADLPGVDGALAGALVSVRRAGSVQSANAVTGEGANAGRFAVELPPDPSYVVSYVPSSPEIPFRAEPLSLLDDTLLSVDLGAGVAIWGSVTGDLGQPLAGVAVRAVASDGLAGAPAYTDDNGVYLLRVTPGAWTVRCDGRSSGRDPVLSQGVVVSEDGLPVDFEYSSLALASVAGRVVDASGAALTSARVRLASADLDAYAAATYDVEVLTNRDGNFDTRVPPGRYRAEIVPDGGIDLTAVTIDDVIVADDFVDLGETVLPSFAEVVGVVTDADGQALDGAVLTFREVGFGRRSYPAITDDSGGFALAAPRTPVDVWITPPPHRADLATTRIRYEPTSETAPVFVLGAGVAYEGAVFAADADGTDRPVAFGVVEVVDDAGDRWGAALTDDRGRFAVRVDWNR